LVQGALSRIYSELRAEAPYLYVPVTRWLESLPDGGRAEEYFTGARDVIFRMPWLLESSFRAPDLSWHRDLTYSSVNAYYYVRLIDNAADERGSAELALLPAAGFFHLRFVSAYMPHFHAAHPFWKCLGREASLMAEAAVRDSAATTVSLDHFLAVTARKTAGVRIPMAAVCHRYGRLDLLEPWREFYDVLARVNQLMNDLLDWQDDLDAGVETLILSEARRRRSSGESVTGWLIREGFVWARALAAGWLEELRRMCPACKSEALTEYLAERQRQVLDLLDTLIATSEELATLAQLLEPPSTGEARRVDGPAPA
jgi:hypothetical protein